MKNNTIKKIGNVAFVLCLCALFCCGTWYECHYSKDCVVVRVDDVDNYTTFEDNLGNYWEADGVCYEVGETVRLTFYTKHTDDNIDDEIVEIVKKSVDK